MHAKSFMHICESIPYGREFPAHVEELIDSLCIRIGLERRQLDMSPYSLKVVDKAAEKLWPHHDDDVELSDDELYNMPPLALFAELTGIVGEVLARTFNGMWRMVKAQNDPEAYEPIIENVDGEFYFVRTIFRSVCKDWKVDVYWAFFFIHPQTLRKVGFKSTGADWSLC